MPQRLIATRQRRKLGRELRADLRRKLRGGEVEPLSFHDVPADRLNIVMRDAKFSYVDGEGDDAAGALAQLEDPLQGNDRASHGQRRHKSKKSKKKTMAAAAAMQNESKRKSVKISDMSMGASEIEQGKIVTIIGAKSQVGSSKQACNFSSMAFSDYFDCAAFFLDSAIDTHCLPSWHDEPHCS